MFIALNLKRAFWNERTLTFKDTSLAHKPSWHWRMHAPVTAHRRGQAPHHGRLQPESWLANREWAVKKQTSWALPQLSFRVNSKYLEEWINKTASNMPLPKQRSPTSKPSMQKAEKIYAIVLALRRQMLAYTLITLSII